MQIPVRATGLVVVGTVGLFVVGCGIVDPSGPALTNQSAQAAAAGVRLARLTAGGIRDHCGGTVVSSEQTSEYRWSTVVATAQHCLVTEDVLSVAFDSSCRESQPGVMKGTCRSSLVTRAVLKPGYDVNQGSFDNSAFYRLMRYHTEMLLFATLFDNSAAREAFLRLDDSAGRERMLAVAAADIALVVVDADHYVRPLSLAAMPQPRDAVTLSGFPFINDLLHVQALAQELAYARQKDEALAERIDAARLAVGSSLPAINAYMNARIACIDTCADASEIERITFRSDCVRKRCVSPQHPTLDRFINYLYENYAADEEARVVPEATIANILEGSRLSLARGRKIAGEVSDFGNGTVVEVGTGSFTMSASKSGDVYSCDGDSGTGVLNDRGELVGVLSAGACRSHGLSYAAAVGQGWVARQLSQLVQ